MKLTKKRRSMARQKRSRPEKPALNQVISADAELCRKGMCFGLNSPETSRTSTTHTQRKLSQVSAQTSDVV
jgi:hypothetical protein